MEIHNNNNEKRNYQTPLIERIHLDNEISLALSSQEAPPSGPGESYAPEYFNNDPFKANMA